MDKLYILLPIIGGCLAIFGVIRLVKILIKKPVARLPFSEEPVTVTFSRPATYALVVLGLQHVRNAGNFGLTVSGAGSRHIEVSEKKMKVRRSYLSETSTEYLQFTIDVPGKYTLQLHNPASLQASQLQLFTAFGNSNARTAKGFSVREAVSIKDFAIAIVSIILGINLITLGTLLLSGGHVR